MRSCFDLHGLLAQWSPVTVSHMCAAVQKDVIWVQASGEVPPGCQSAVLQTNAAEAPKLPPRFVDPAGSGTIRRKSAAASPCLHMRFATFGLDSARTLRPFANPAR